MKPTVIVLIGLPASGKSTWREKYLEDNDAVVASSDDIIDRLCEEAGITYNEGFQKFVGGASAEFEQTLKNAFKDKKNIIVDRTNMSIKSRKKYLKMAEQHGYLKMAVNFVVPDSVIAERMDARFKATGKSVPAHIMKSMANNYDAPTKSEGFDEIKTVRF